MTEQQGHSEDYFKSYRDHWWNADFLELMARRLRLAECRTVLDVGCGQCHWSSVLLPFLASNALVTGVDQDPKWVNASNPMSDRFSRANATVKIHEANACELPFADNSFDLVTCQTLLIHVADPFAAVKEMARVVRPGGLVLCVEPNNSVQSLIRGSMNHDDSVEERLRSVQYSVIYETGKRMLGEGDSSFGDFVAEALHNAELEDIRVYLSDKTSPLIPPYNGPEQEALVATIREWAAESSGPNDGDTARRYFAAFDGKYDEVLSSIRSTADEDTRTYLAQIESRQFITSGAVLMYLTSGRKPAR